MKNVRLALALSLASLLAFAPIELAQANDAHHPGASATTKQVIKKKPRTPKKSGMGQQSGQMSASAMMNCPMMRGGQSAAMSCPMMSSGSAGMMRMHHAKRHRMMHRHQRMHGPMMKQPHG